MENREDNFRFTYSAAQQAEVEQIRKKYLPPEEDKLERLRKLDAGATGRAQGWAIGLGVVGSLILGWGMSLIMTPLGAWLGETPALILGILVGLTGLVAIALAYPVYQRVLRRQRQRIAPEILRLTEELMN